MAQYTPTQLQFVEFALIKTAETRGPIDQWMLDRRLQRPRARERLLSAQAAKMESAGLLPENPESSMFDEDFMTRVMEFLNEIWPLIMQLADLFSRFF